MTQQMNVAKIFGSLFIVGFVGVAPVWAGPIIYDNGGPDTSRPGWRSDFVLPVQEADDFVLTTDNVIADIHWWGSYDAVVNNPDNFTIRIFTDGGAPAQNPLIDLNVGSVTRVDTGDDTVLNAGGDTGTLYEYWVEVDPIVLDLNTTYYLSIVNNTDDPSLALSGNWRWSATSTDNGHWSRGADNTSWNSQD